MKKTKMLKKNFEFRQVLTKGSYYPGKYINIFILRNGKNINKIGLAISKKCRKSISKK